MINGLHWIPELDQTDTWVEEEGWFNVIERNIFQCFTVV